MATANLKGTIEETEDGTFVEKLADMCKAPVDLVSDDDSEAQGEKRGRSCDSEATLILGEDPLEKRGKASQKNSLQLPLREYIRIRAFGKWVSVATSPRGSYRTSDILNLTPQLRRWRIIMADYFSAHLSPQVFRLCWPRGYVFIARGGGVTHVVQTPDTDLNQHVKACEGAAQMRRSSSSCATAWARTGAEQNNA